MKVGDLVKIKNLTSSDYGVIVKTHVRGSGCLKQRWWKVRFPTLDYDVPFMENELELV